MVSALLIGTTINKDEPDDQKQCTVSCYRRNDVDKLQYFYIFCLIYRKIQSNRNYIGAK